MQAPSWGWTSGRTFGLPSMVLTGIGVGLTLGTLIAAGVQSLPGGRTATGSALVNSFRQISSAPSWRS